MILVLGSTGFVGRNVLQLLSKSHSGQVRALVRKNASPAKMEPIKTLTGIELIEGDILDITSLKKAMQGIDVVLNFAQVTAGFKNVDNLYWRVNVEGTRNVVKTAKEAGVKLFIFGGGLGTEPGKPGSYMETRWEAEEAVRNSGIDYVILQPSIIFGNGSEFFEAQARITNQLPVATVIGNGKDKFQPIYVEDFARIVLETLTRPDKKGRSIPLGGPDVFNYKELVEMIVKAVGKKRMKISLPLWAAKVNAGLFNLLPNPPLTPATLELFGFDNITDNPQVIEQEFGFKPTHLKDYLEKEGIQFHK